VGGRRRFKEPALGVSTDIQSNVLSSIVVRALTLYEFVALSYFVRLSTIILRDNNRLIALGELDGKKQRQETVPILLPLP
jgi:hypothetical protein